MANLAGDHRGLVVRISAMPPLAMDLVRLDEPQAGLSLMPLAFDLDTWLATFDRLWPTGSEAAVSYRDRILLGTSRAPADILL